MHGEVAASDVQAIWIGGGGVESGGGSGDRCSVRRGIYRVQHRVRRLGHQTEFMNSGVNLAPGVADWGFFFPQRYFDFPLEAICPPSFFRRLFSTRKWCHSFIFVGSVESFNKTFQVLPTIGHKRQRKTTSNSTFGLSTEESGAPSLFSPSFWDMK